MFTCYDFWFRAPMNTLIQRGITDFLFPNELASGPPVFIMAHAVAGWSARHSVNVVASSSFGTGASGAFQKGEIVGLVRSLCFLPAILILISLLTSAFQINPMPFNFTNAHAVGVANLTGASAKQRSVPVLSAAEANPPVVRSPSTGVAQQTCVYGPPINGLNFTIGCTVFHPLPNKQFRLTASHKSIDGNRLDCHARVTTASTSQRSWVLAAIYVALPDSVETPSGLRNAMCLLIECNDPREQNCFAFEAKA